MLNDILMKLMYIQRLHGSKVAKVSIIFLESENWGLFAILSPNVLLMS